MTETFIHIKSEQKGKNSGKNVKTHCTCSRVQHYDVLFSIQDLEKHIFTMNTNEEVATVLLEAIDQKCLSWLEK